MRKNGKRATCFGPWKLGVEMGLGEMGLEPYYNMVISEHGCVEAVYSSVQNSYSYQC